MPRLRTRLVALVLASLAASVAAAQDAAPPQSGVAEGYGTRFAIADGPRSGLVLEVTDPVEVRIESAAEGIVIELVPAAFPPSTGFKLAGLPPGQVLHRYDTDLADHERVVADATGSLTWEQDLSQPHLLLLQERPSTIFLTDSGWSDPSVGTWDPVGRVATLTRDLTETLQVSGTGLTLDGAGHRVDSGNLVGVYVPSAADIAIRRLAIAGAAYGLRLYYSTGVSAVCNDISASVAGIDVHYGAGHRFVGNTAAPAPGSVAFTPLRLRTVQGSEVASNRFSGPQGVWMYSCVGNTIRYNQVNADGAPLWFLSNSWYNTFYNNTFHSTQGLGPFVQQTGPNAWSQPRPAGGNHWSPWTGPDADADGFVDVSYEVAGLVDSLPVAAPDGWAFEVQTTAGPGGAILPCGPLLLGCGATQQFVFEPEPGHTVVDVLVDGVSLGPMGAYTLTSACGAHSVEAVFETQSGVVAVEAGGARLSLTARGPNPFRNVASLAFALAAQSRVRLAVYDVTGRETARLREGILPAGSHLAAWDGRREDGGRAAPGVYLARLEAQPEEGGAGGTVTRRLVLLP
jgi:parallel beta-helix repeat protein